MLWKTHIRIANEILHRLGIPKNSIQASRLKEGSIIPDKWRDYPHHHGKSGTIQRYILDARRFFLAGDLANACFNLGVALHYVQDSYTSLSSRSKHHSSWEQQIEDSFFVNNLEECVTRAFRDRPDRREEYTARARLLSDNVEGKEKTLRLAAMPAPGLTFSGHHIYGRPYVDLNFALKASFLIAKSVLGSRECPKLQAYLKRACEKHEGLLRETETSLVNEIVELINKRDESKRKRRKDGVLQTLRNFFLMFSSKIHDLQAKSRIGNYEQKKHFEKVLRRYDGRVKKIVEAHRGWYDFTIPQINIDIIEKELLTAQQASEFFQTEEALIQDLTKKQRISCYHVKGKQFIRKSQLKKALET